MDQDNQLSVDINLADAETLTQLQGVGGRLAERIIEARPFESIDDLTRVRGISDKDLERLRPFLTISAATALTEAVEEVVNDTIETATEVESEDVVEAVDEVEILESAAEPEVVTETIIESVDDDVIALEAADEIEGVQEEEDEAVLEELEPVEETPAPVAPPAYITRGGACSLIFLSGLVTLVLAIVITLGILSTFNNRRLSYASPNQIAALQAEAESLSTQANILAEDIDSLRTRMDNLEALSGQVSEMQTEFADLQEEIVNLQATVASNQEEFDLLVAQLEVISENIDELGDQTERSEGFLEGLRSLLDNLFPETPEVEESP